MICIEIYKLTPLFISYIYAFLASLLIKVNIDTLWSKVKGVTKQIPEREPWHPQFLGLMNLFMYLTSFIYGKPEFIFAWLAVVTVPQISYWKENRTLYNIFLIGNSMNIIFSFISFMLFNLLTDGKIIESLILGIICYILFIGTFLYSRGLKILKI